MSPGGPGISAAGSKARAVSYPAASAPSRRLEVRAPHEHVKQVSELLIVSFHLGKLIKANNSGETLN